MDRTTLDFAVNELLQKLEHSSGTEKIAVYSDGTDWQIAVLDSPVMDVALEPIRSIDPSFFVYDVSDFADSPYPYRDMSNIFVADRLNAEYDALVANESNSSFFPDEDAEQKAFALKQLFVYEADPSNDYFAWLTTQPKMMETLALHGNRLRVDVRDTSDYLDYDDTKAATTLALLDNVAVLVTQLSDADILSRYSEYANKDSSPEVALAASFCLISGYGERFKVADGVDGQLDIIKLAARNLDISLTAQVHPKLTQEELDNILDEYQLYLSGRRDDFQSLSGYDMRGLNFRGSDLTSVDFTNALLDGADFSGTQLRDTVWHFTQARNTNFAGADFYDADMDAGNFAGANFSSAAFSAITAKDAVFTDTTWTDAAAYATSFSEHVFDYANFEGALGLGENMLEHLRQAIVVGDNILLDAEIIGEIADRQLQNSAIGLGLTAAQKITREPIVSFSDDYAVQTVLREYLASDYNVPVILASNPDNTTSLHNAIVAFVNDHNGNRYDWVDEVLSNYPNALIIDPSDDVYDIKQYAHTIDENDMERLERKEALSARVEELRTELAERRETEMEEKRQVSIYERAEKELEAFKERISPPFNPDDEAFMSKLFSYTSAFRFMQNFENSFAETTLEYLSSHGDSVLDAALNIFPMEDIENATSYVDAEGLHRGEIDIAWHELGNPREIAADIDLDARNCLDADRVMALYGHPDVIVPGDTQMQQYGYTYPAIFPLREARALELYDMGGSILKLYDNGAEAYAESREELEAHLADGGFAGIEPSSWEAVNLSIMRQNRIASLLDTLQSNYEQLVDMPGYNVSELGAALAFMRDYMHMLTDNALKRVLEHPGAELTLEYVVQVLPMRYLTPSLPAFARGLEYVRQPQNELDKIISDIEKAVIEPSASQSEATLSTQELTYKVIEDNGGGLTLVINEGDEVIYMHGGYEYRVGELLVDIAGLEHGFHPRDWDGNMSAKDVSYTNGNGEEVSCETLTEAFEVMFTDEAQSNGGWDVVADNNTLYANRMGGAASAEFLDPDNYKTSEDLVRAINKSDTWSFPLLGDLAVRAGLGSELEASRDIGEPGKGPDFTEVAAIAASVFGLTLDNVDLPPDMYYDSTIGVVRVFDTFSDAIQAVEHDVNSENEAPFVIFRDYAADEDENRWKIAQFISRPDYDADDVTDWAFSIMNEKDSCAVLYRASDEKLVGGTFSDLYLEMLRQRLIREYEDIIRHEDIYDKPANEVYLGFTHGFAEQILDWASEDVQLDSLSDRALEYLVEMDMPLAALSSLTPPEDYTEDNIDSLRPVLEAGLLAMEVNDILKENEVLSPVSESGPSYLDLAYAMEPGEGFTPAVIPVSLDLALELFSESGGTLALESFSTWDDEGGTHYRHIQVSDESSMRRSSEEDNAVLAIRATDYVAHMSKLLERDKAIFDQPSSPVSQESNIANVEFNDRLKGMAREALEDYVIGKNNGSSDVSSYAAGRIGVLADILGGSFNPDGLALEWSDGSEEWFREGKWVDYSGTPLPLPIVRDHSKKIEGPEVIVAELSAEVAEPEKIPNVYGSISEVALELLPNVQSELRDPVIVYYDAPNWHIFSDNALYTPLGLDAELMRIREIDPLAASFSGVSLSSLYYKGIALEVLGQRVVADEELHPYFDDEKLVSAAVVDLLSYSEARHDLTDGEINYLATSDRPLQTFLNLIPVLEEQWELGEDDPSFEDPAKIVELIKEGITDIKLTPESLPDYYASYREAITAIMPEANTVPFVLYRDKHTGRWGVYTVPDSALRTDKVEDFVDVIRKTQDRYAKVYTGREFGMGSYSQVFDQVVKDRVWSGFLARELIFEENGRGFPEESSLQETIDDYRAIANFFDEAISEMEHDVVEYLAECSDPLEVLNRLTTSVALTPWTVDEHYNESRHDVALKAIVNGVANRRAEEIREEYGLPDPAVSDEDVSTFRSANPGAFPLTQARAEQLQAAGILVKTFTVSEAVDFGSAQWEEFGLDALDWKKAVEEKKVPVPPGHFDNFASVVAFASETVKANPDSLFVIQKDPHHGWLYREDDSTLKVVDPYAVSLTRSMTTGRDVSDVTDNLLKDRMLLEHRINLAAGLYKETAKASKVEDLLLNHPSFMKHLTDDTVEWLADQPLPFKALHDAVSPEVLLELEDVVYANLAESGVLEARWNERQAELGKRVPMPDATVSFMDMVRHGNKSVSMLPLSYDKALELADKGLDLYVLHEDNTSSVVDRSELEEFFSDCMCGIEYHDWCSYYFNELGRSDDALSVPSQASIGKDSSGIEIAGHTGTWYVIDGTLREGGLIFLLESEQHGDEAPNLIVDKTGTVLVDEVHNGFLDYDDKYEWKLDPCAKPDPADLNMYHKVQSELINEHLLTPAYKLEVVRMIESGDDNEDIAIFLEEEFAGLSSSANGYGYKATEDGVQMTTPTGTPISGECSYEALAFFSRGLADAWKAELDAKNTIDGIQVRQQKPVKPPPQHSLPENLPYAIGDMFNIKGFNKPEIVVGITDNRVYVASKNLSYHYFDADAGCAYDMSFSRLTLEEMLESGVVTVTTVSKDPAAEVQSGRDNGLENVLAAIAQNQQKPTAKPTPPPSSAKVEENPPMKKAAGGRGR